MDIAVSFNATYMGENDKISQTGSVSLFNFKVRAFIYNRDSKEKEWVNRYIDVKAFDKLADRIRAMEKGKVCYIRGTIEEVRAYINSKSSEAVGVLSILADNVVATPREFEQTEDSGRSPVVEEEDDDEPVRKKPVRKDAPTSRVNV